MFKCNNCNSEFEYYDTFTEASGEKWYVCPYCRDNNFNDVIQRSENDKYLFIKKSMVIDYVVTAIAFINKLDVEVAKETLTELIGEVVGSPFEYKSALEAVTDESDKLIAEIQTMLEVVKV